MAYNLKDVFYLGHSHEYAASDYSNNNESGVNPIDISAFVDPISKGKSRGQGLAIYKVHSFVAGDVEGGSQISSDVGQVTFGLTVKPYSTTGDGFTTTTTPLENGDLTPESDLLIYGAEYAAPASRTNSNGTIFSAPNKAEYLTPSKEVPYVCVRDTIFQIFLANLALSANDSMFISTRLECAMVSLDTATLNQLLRTQTA